jgi:NCS1 family nucleobase:cation symporter-1
MSAADDHAQFGRLPLGIGEREYGNLSAHGTCFAYAIATWCFLVGSYSADLLPAIPGTVCLIAGNLIGVFLTTMPLSLGCQRYGIEQMDFCKSAFGHRGAQVLMIFYLMNMFGWSGLLLVMFGNGFLNIGRAFDLDGGEWLVRGGVALGIWLSYVVVSRGVERLGVVNNIVTPALGLVVAYMLWMLFSAHGIDAVISAPPLAPREDSLLNYALVLELGIANGFSWWGGIGFIARNSKTRRAATYPQLLQLGLASGVVSSIALYSALVVGSDDPTEWMIPLGGVAMGVLALTFVALANLTSVAVSLFAAGLAMRHLPPLQRVPWKAVLLLSLVPCACFAVWPTLLYDLGDAFLAYNGSIFAPISGVMFVDYFLLRRERLCLHSLFDAAPGTAYHFWRGLNPVALAAVVVGQLAYFMLYNPVTGETHWLFHYLPASIAAFGSASLLHGLGMWIWGEHRAHALAEAGSRISRPTI